MSFTYMNNIKMVDKGLVDKILEQGQKLRNSMVGSILKNDPFNTEVIYNQHFNSPQISQTDMRETKMMDNLTSLEEKRLDAFIKGEYMTKDEEKLALDTLRSLSAPALCKTTEKSLHSPRLSTCRCYTCEMYNSNNLYCDLRRNNVNQNVHVHESNSYPINDVTKDIRDKYGTENGNILQYVDSLKVSISSLVLNENGNQKVSFVNDKKVPYNLSQTYFLEYSVPECLVSRSTESKSKVNSGLDTNHVRLCSRKNGDTIHFKQVTIHDIKNMARLNLDDHELKFRISFRTAKQKTASLLGFAKFNLGTFLYSKSLTCHRGLSVFLNDSSPIVVGVLKVSLQLGCGRLYFGQEFIDAINSTQRNSVVLDSEDSASQLNSKQADDDIYNDSTREREQIYSKNNDAGRGVEKLLKNSSNLATNRTDRNVKVDSAKRTNVEQHKITKKSSYFEKGEQNSLQNNLKQNNGDLTKNVKETDISRVLTRQISDKEKEVLFGFLYISEAQYLRNPITSYITLRPFCQNETSCSQLITSTSHPIFNFYQLVPLIFEDELLHLLRENYMVIEFWQKQGTTDVIIGLTKISLHQFYLAYRNPVLLRYLAKNQLPIIGTDWWEPIYATESEEIVGQVQVLIALGTEQQITNLKNERGFLSNTVKAKFPCPTPRIESARKTDQSQQFITAETDRSVTKTLQKYGPRENNNVVSKINHRNILYKDPLDENLDSKKKTRDQAINTTLKTVQKSDIGVQSDLEMDKRDKLNEEVEKSPSSATQDMLGSFLQQLMSQRQRNVYVENSTNTDTVQFKDPNASQPLQKAQLNTDVELRKTTDLLDSLQKALSLDGINNATGSKRGANTFKAKITINKANHLPSRKKCKSKKTRNRSMKNEENVLPSCYVTFETTVENNLRITPVVSKSTAPVWNYICEVDLPTNLLTNNQKRLIFKVWRKSTNAVLQPNMQTDTVLGFAAVDLTVLLAGFPNVQGWFNIVDFSGKCNGQINIHITPLEDLSRYVVQRECNCNVQNAALQTVQTETAPPCPEVEPTDTFSRALKRKFTELDEITQRLRLRLSKVTNDDSDASSDGIADEFEKDINTLCIEEDFNLINFEEEARKLNVNCGKDTTDSSGGTSKVDLEACLVKTNETSESTSSGNLMQVANEKKDGLSAVNLGDREASDVLRVDVDMSAENELAVLDKHLLQGKQRIDTLLEKLSLLSADTNNPFTSRYVSGCSINSDNQTNIDTEAILKELDHDSRPNIQSSSGFDPLMFQQLYGGSACGNSSKSSSVTTTRGYESNSGSDTSLITNLSDGRPAPDGQGNVTDEKLGKKPNV